MVGQVLLHFLPLAPKHLHKAALETCSRDRLTNGQGAGDTQGYKSCAWQVRAGPGVSAGSQRQVNVLRLEKWGYSRVTNLASCTPKLSYGQRLRKKRKLQHGFTWFPWAHPLHGAGEPPLPTFFLQHNACAWGLLADLTNQMKSKKIIHKKCKNYKSKLMYFYVYNCPNDRYCLVPVCEKHRLNENVIYVPVNQHCLKTCQWIKISLSPGKNK